ncbi:MAG: Uma2 family endonuclease [Cyanobacteriota bacterium]|nr:Uma2 family endonuclease [Cyanobacteriota bacterium]
MIITLKLVPVIELTDEQFYQLCQINPHLRLELNVRKDLVISPADEEDTEGYNAKLVADFNSWNQTRQLGKVFDFSTSFILPNGATRSPNVSWVQIERWNQLTPEQQAGFPAMAPDFVLELVFFSDDLTDVQEKMKEYIDNGVRLGWLINYEEKFVEIYRPTQPVEMVKMPAVLSGEDVLPGFGLSL